MRAVHLIVALLAFGAFGITGLYMHFALDHLRDMDMSLRAFYRSRHIYILLAALVNAGLGAYLRTATWRGLQRIGSTLIVAGTVALVFAFFAEAETKALRSPISTFALYGLAAGSLCHVVAGLRLSPKESAPRQQ